MTSREQVEDDDDNDAGDTLARHALAAIMAFHNDDDNKARAAIAS